MDADVDALEDDECVVAVLVGELTPSTVPSVSVMSSAVVILLSAVVMAVGFLRVAVRVGVTMSYFLACVVVAALELSVVTTSLLLLVDDVGIPL